MFAVSKQKKNPLVLVGMRASRQPGEPLAVRPIRVWVLRRHGMRATHTRSFAFLRLCARAAAGAIATGGVLCAGLVAFRKGNQHMSQQMMRTRVLFQVGVS